MTQGDGRLLLLMDENSDGTTSTSKPKSKSKGINSKKQGDRAAQEAANKNDWDILNEAEAQAFSEIHKTFVKHSDKVSKKVENLMTSVYELKNNDKPYDKLLDRAINAGSVEALFFQAEELAEDNQLEAALPYYYAAHKHRHPEAAYNCAIHCYDKALEIDTQEDRKEEVESWLRKSLACYRDAIMLYLTDDTKLGDESCAKYLYDAWHNAAVVAAQLRDMKLSVFCLYAMLELRKEVEQEEVRSKLAELLAIELMSKSKGSKNSPTLEEEAIAYAQNKIGEDIDKLVFSLFNLHSQLYELEGEDLDDYFLGKLVTIPDLYPPNSGSDSE